MASEPGDRRPARTQVMGTRPPESESESELKLPCPRCESTNTKFCYYNNYNLSQPRHFCKACRRYWTRGGTLRNVPVGGATRKSSSKRPRTAAAAAASATSSSSSSTVTNDPASVGPATISEVGLNDTVAGDGGLTFTEWLNAPRVSGFGPLSGLGLVSGFQGVGFGLNAWDWPMEQASEGNGGGRGGSGGESAYAGPSSGCNTWGSGGVDIEGGLAADGDCLAWPDLAISTPGQGQ